MIKNTLVFFIAILMVVSWGYVVFVEFREEAPHLMAIAMLVPCVLAGIIVYLQLSSLPDTKIGSIVRLAKDIESRIDEAREPIDERIAPIEIRPLVNAINRLIESKEDRYRQERDFTANASHELRTPLAGIRIQTQIALKTENREQRDGALKNILSAVDRGTRLVEQLLILSRLTAERVELEKTEVNLGEIATQVAGELAPIANEKNISININPWQAEDKIFGNYDSLAILIQNIILNSIIYGNENGRIDVSFFRKKDSITLSVCDDGPGIPGEQKSYITERFKKAKSNTKTGTGLGLAIVKRIAELHQTTPEFTDGDGGKGLKVEMVFNLPYPK